MEDLNTRQEITATLKKLTNYSSERKLMTLRNKIVKHMRRNPPPNKTQFEHEYIRGASSSRK